MKFTIFPKTDHLEHPEQSKLKEESFDITHMCMFDNHEIALYFLFADNQLPVIKALIDNYVLFKVQGQVITLLPENSQGNKNYQRARFRFDDSHKS